MKELEISPDNDKNRFWRRKRVRQLGVSSEPDAKNSKLTIHLSNSKIPGATDGLRALLDSPVCILGKGLPVSTSTLKFFQQEHSATQGQTLYLNGMGEKELKVISPNN